MKYDFRDKIEQLLQAIKGRTEPFDFLIALDQLCHLFFLKMLDEEEANRVQQASPSPSSLKPLFPLQTARYRWQRWCGLPADELLPFVRDEVFPYMGTLTRDDQEVGEHFRDAQLMFGIPESFATVVKIISDFEFTAMSLDEKVEFDRYLISRLADISDPDSSYIKLPPALARLMLESTQPQINEAVFDPTASVGDLLIATLAHLQRNSRQGSLGRFHKTLWGVEKSRQLVRICKVRLMLNGLRDTSIHLVDIFGEGALDHASDVILAAPPMRIKAVYSPESLQFDRSPDFAFLHLCMLGLAPGGRCAIVVPDSLLTGLSRTLIMLRKKLITDFDLLAVIKLPQNVLPAKARIKVSLLVFRKPLEFQLLGPVPIWFYEVRHLDGPTKQRFSISHLLKLWEDYRASNFQQPPGPETMTRLSPEAAQPCCWWASKRDVELANFNLETKKWQPQVVEDGLANDPEVLVTELIADYQKIVSGLQELMKEIKEVKE